MPRVEKLTRALKLLVASCVLLGVFAKSTVISQTDKKVIAEEADDTGPRLFYVTERAGLLQVANSRYAVTGQFEKGERTLAVDYHYPRDLLFWTTAGGEIFSCALHASRGLARVENASLVHRETRWHPAALAVDHVADRLYILDTRTNSLRKMGLWGECQEVLHVGARSYRPTYLEIDADAGFLFLVDGAGAAASRAPGHILRISINSSESRFVDPSFVDFEVPTLRIALDRVNKRLLVTASSQKRILSVDYEGQIPTTVIEQQSSALSMSPTKDQLFWVNEAYYVQGLGFPDGSVYRCQYTTAGCRADSVRKIRDGYKDGPVLAVRALEPASQSTSSLPMPPNTHVTCTCKPLTEYIIYEDAWVIRTAPLEPTHACRTLVEPFIAELSLRHGERTGFDYDSDTRRLYYGGKDAIYRVNSDTGARTELLHQRGVFFGPLTLDWVTKNLYYSEIERRGNISFYVLKVISVRDDDPLIAQRSSSLLWELGGLYSMVVHPYRGHLFLSVFYHVLHRYQLIRLSVDGVNVTTMPHLGDAGFLSIDYPKDRLYVLDVSNSSVSRCDMDGGSVERVFEAKIIANVTGFLVHGDWLYIKNRTGIWRFGKASGKPSERLDLFPYDRDMSASPRIHSIKTQSIDPLRNPCAVNNGGCDNFCFALPSISNLTAVLRKSCRCFDGVKCKAKS